MDTPSEVDDLCLDIIHRIAHNELVPRSHGNNGVRCRLNRLDEVGVEQQRMAVESGEQDHGSNVIRREKKSPRSTQCKDRGRFALAVRGQVRRGLVLRRAEVDQRLEILIGG